MRLSAEMYDQIVNALRSDIARDKDKRREPRVGLAGEADIITVDADGKKFCGQIRVRDVSASGIGLSFQLPMAVGHRFVLQLHGARGGRIWLVCLAAYSRKGVGGRYMVGARVKQIMRDEQIQKVEAQTAAIAGVSKPVSAVEMADVDRISKAILG